MACARVYLPSALDNTTCRVHSTNALLVECTRQTHCLSSAFNKRTTLLSSALDRRTSVLSSTLDIRTACRIRERQCAIVERDRQSASALDRRTVLFWSAIGNRSVPSTSTLDKRIVTNSALYCQRSTMAFEHHAHRHGRPLRTHATRQDASKHSRHTAPPARVSMSASWHVACALTSGSMAACASDDHKTNAAQWYAISRGKH